MKRLETDMKRPKTYHANGQEHCTARNVSRFKIERMTVFVFVRFYQYLIFRLLILSKKYLKLLKYKGYEDVTRKNTQQNELKASPPLEPRPNTQLLQVDSSIKRTKSILKSPSSANDTRFSNDNDSKEFATNAMYGNRIDTSPSHLDPQCLIPFTKSTTNLPNKQQPREKSFTNEIECIKRMLLEPQTYNRQNQLLKGTRESASRYPLSRSRTERIFIKSPTPVREIPVVENLNQKQIQSLSKSTPKIEEIETNTSNKGRDRFADRFAKKKLALRSQSAELSKLIDADTFNDITEKSHPRVSLKTQPLIRIISPPLSNRPNLTRQNAFTKSLGDNLNKMHQNNEEIRRKHRKKHHRHHRHRHNHNRKQPSNYNKVSHSSKHKLNNKKSHYKSSSLTSSSSSSMSTSELATKSESSFTSSSTYSSPLLSDYTREQMKNAKFNNTVDNRANKLIGNNYWSFDFLFPRFFGCLTRPENVKLQLEILTF
jgi:hypothetical protein